MPGPPLAFCFCKGMEKHRNRKVVNATHKIEKREIQHKVGTELR
jgi:hypothetical protein